MSLTNGRTLGLGLALVVFAAYANHFQNDFHFDDVQTVAANGAIQSLGDIRRFVTDATLFSDQTGGQNWRPIVTRWQRLLAERGFKPFFFSTFVWFLVLVVLMFLLFRLIMDRADAHPSNTCMALPISKMFGKSVP